MKKNTAHLKPETFYHIYNRGINGEDIFKAERNYFFFLKKYEKYISLVASTYAYCLLKNHFHFLIRTHSEGELKAVSTSKNKYEADQIISLQFSHFFNCYAQAINKTFCRTGGLFETPFRRIAVEDEEYVTQLIYYIHFNPQKHCFVKDFRTYKHSSYSIYLNNKKTFLERRAGIEWFGSKFNFINQHNDWTNLNRV